MPGVVCFVSWNVSPVSAPHVDCSEHTQGRGGTVSPPTASPHPCGKSVAALGSSPGSALAACGTLGKLQNLVKFYGAPVRVGRAWRGSGTLYTPCKWI